MARSKGQICLRLTNSPSGKIASILYRGPSGKRTLKNLGFCDWSTPEGKAKCASALDAIFAARKLAEEASR